MEVRILKNSQEQSRTFLRTEKVKSEFKRIQEIEKSLQNIFAKIRRTKKKQERDEGSE
jgi:hypothetical protein